MEKDEAIARAFAATRHHSIRQSEIFENALADYGYGVFSMEFISDLIQKLADKEAANVVVH